MAEMKVFQCDCLGHLAEQQAKNKNNRKQKGSSELVSDSRTASAVPYPSLVMDV